MPDHIFNIFKFVTSQLNNQIMKRNKLMRIALSGIILFSVCIDSFGYPVDRLTAKRVAENKLVALNKTNDVRVQNMEQIIGENGLPWFFIFVVEPKGFIVISADTDLPPVLAYSFDSDYTTGLNEENVVIRFLKADVKKRLAALEFLPQKIIGQRNQQWENLLAQKPDGSPTKKFEQWPPEGTTSTGGWLETNWTQSAPYNNLCPMDPVTNLRSIAGCPAVAMAQIVNYYKTINGTTFTDADDYHHNYAGRNYWIDDDYEEIGFPSFPDLNLYLDTVSLCFSNQTNLKQNEQAALVFACGVAATQVYTSSASGTFGVNQAVEAYSKFGCTEAVFFNDGDTALYSTLSQNMKDARPAHLAVVDPGWTMGHNLVIDGYNTDDFYHLNFGWGGTYNSWYLLPDEIPYGLTVIEGVIADIGYPQSMTSIQTNRVNVTEIEISPNPVQDKFTLNFKLNEPSDVAADLYDSYGRMISVLLHDRFQSGSFRQEMSLADLTGTNPAAGIYFIRFRVNDQFDSVKLLIR